MAGSETSDIDVINNALARIGAGPIFAVDEETDLAAQCMAIYRPTVSAMLGRYPFSFACRTYRLNAVAADATNGYDATAKRFDIGWRYGFYLPGESIGLPHRVLTDPRRPNHPLRQFAIEENKIFAEFSPLWATVPVWAAISTWLPGFRLAAETYLAANLAVPVTHDKALAEDLMALAVGGRQDNGIGGLFGQAILLDAQQAGSQAAMVSDPLSAARLM